MYLLIELTALVRSKSMPSRFSTNLEFTCALTWRASDAHGGFARVFCSLSEEWPFFVDVAVPFRPSLVP
jgi:hypothetical protein